MPTRRNAFETNSSSMHSIVMADIRPGDILIIPTPNDQGNIVPDLSYEFGWGYEEYNDFWAKLAYFIIDNQNINERIDMLKNVIKKYTKGNLVIGEISGYIDHQSCGETGKIRNEKDLVNFLFNDKVLLIIDNDNH